MEFTMGRQNARNPSVDSPWSWHLLQHFRMPTIYTCTSCKIRFDVGSYHGFKGEWYNAVYCRKCGASVRIKQSAGQFLSAFGGDKNGPHERRYELSGPVTPKVIVINSDTKEIPMVECACGAKGPFGNHGPITDNLPKGFGESAFGFRNDVGKCPRCKKKTLRKTGEFVT